MSIAVDLLKADRIGVRAFKEHVSTKFLNNLLLITDRGKPVSVNLPYQDVLELVDILDELTDVETLKTVAEGSCVDFSPEKEKRKNVQIRRT